MFFGRNFGPIQVTFSLHQKCYVPLTRDTPFEVPVCRDSV
jgi:hypothetical protein